MDCPTCKSHTTRVLETRLDKNKNIRRRRECTKCGLRISTVENFKPKHVKKDLE